jgi:hypothetical protein
MAFKYCMSRVRGRGAGLGNELIPWARSFLAAQVLGAAALPPAFGINRRRYWRHFGTPRYDWLAHRALEKVLPVFEFTEADHQRHGAGDVVKTFRGFAEENDLFNRSAYVVVTEGMWGGYLHVTAARDFIRSTLYQSRFAARNLVRLQERLKPGLPVVGMHVRMGDFDSASDPASYQGKFNVSLPLQWYINIAHSIRSQLNGEVQFIIASDANAEQLRPLSDGVRCVVTAGVPDSDCSDLLALSNADLLVCSVSSFSAWAAFLSSAPYLWYLPNLQCHPEGFHSIWGHETGQQMLTSHTRAAMQAWKARYAMSPRGWPVADDGNVKADVVQCMLVRRAQLHEAADLVQYGVVPLAPSIEPAGRAYGMLSTADRNAGHLPVGEWPQ